MTNAELVDRIKAELKQLEGGDEAALARIGALLGIATSGDQISVGNISGSSAVAVGSNIRILVSQHTHALPSEILDRLLGMADALERRADETMQGRGHIRVFLASPGDVLDERRLARKVIGLVQNDPLYKQRISIEEVAWDKPDASTPMLAAVDPQTAISQGLPKPSECDIVVVILWSRLGTPLDPARYQKPDGSPYLSGTEWEFEDALTAARDTGRPFILVYRRTEAPRVELDDPQLDSKREQRERVKAFFGAFTNLDGSIKQGYNQYAAPSEFENQFTQHLRQLAARLIEEGGLSQTQPGDGGTSDLLSRTHWPPDRSPFPGLSSFTSEYAPVYFGRGQETDRLVKRLADPECRFLAVVGASGSGKSSLVAAGLLPRLAERAIEGSRDWPVLPFTPDAWGEGDPFLSLASALAREPLCLPQTGLAAQLRESPDALRRLLTEQLQDQPAWAKILIFIDQFEELFTRIPEDKKEAFAALLVEAAGLERVKIVVTMRADFFERVAELPALSRLLNTRQNRTFPLSAPGPVDLYEMIIGPARVAGLEFEGGLARRILAETGNQPGSLTLLAYALEQLWQQRQPAAGREDCLLSRQAYEDFGGVQGAIGRQAQEAFDSLGQPARDALPVVFRELVSFSEAGTATRKRAHCSLAAPDAAAAELAEALTRARLLVRSSGEKGQPIVEVAHEALFSSWPALAEWIEEARADLILLRKVRVAAAEWESSGRRDDFLWSDVRLQPASEMLERLNPTLEGPEPDFVRWEYDRLLEEIEDPDIDHQRRAWIGERLNTLGDRRAGVGLDARGLPDIDWLPVTGGPVNIEGRRFHVAPFQIARFPVSHGQYQAFLEADDGFWDPRWRQGLAAGEDHWGRSGRPIGQNGNEPADSVSWLEAVAFCRWLNARLGLPDMPLDLTPGSLSNYPGIRLPAEWEWQLAASGGDPGNVYPWGPGWDGIRANTSESGLSRSTAVGMYPLGAAACGALDMSGNVWEWCLNEYGNPENTGLAGLQSRVRRGGSFHDNERNVRCAYRGDLDPSPWLLNGGFRVVVAPGFFDFPTDRSGQADL